MTARSLLPVPETLATLAPTMTQRQLRERFGCSHRTLMRWFQIEGVKAMKPPPRTVKAPRRIVGNSQKRFAPVDSYSRDMSIDGQAAEFMAKDRPVYRCNEAGRQDLAGLFWRCGNAIITPAELMERARHKGWDSEGWRNVA